MSLTVLGMVMIGWSLCRTAAIGEELATTPTVSASKPSARTRERFTPPSHAELYAKLTDRRIQLNFEKATIDDALPTLAAALEAPIEFDRTSLSAEALAREFTLATDAPITLKNALQLTLNYAALSEMLISLDSEGVRIVGHETGAKRYVLITHDLREVSNYTTLLRRSIVEQIQKTITPEEWGGANGPWIGPGTSVFAIDVFHRPDAQAEIAKLWRRRFATQRRGIYFVEDAQRGKEQQTEPIDKRVRELRAKYPLESLAGRLEYETGKAGDAPPLAPHVAQLLDEREKREAMSRQPGFAWNNLRGASLQKLHGDEVEKFVSREGFGITRMPQPTPAYLPLAVPPQLALPAAEIDPPSYAEQRVHVLADGSLTSPPFPSQKLLTGFHVGSETLFFLPDRMGYIKDRDHVAGFGGHAFVDLPRVEDRLPSYAEPAEQWAMRRIELVSLLKHKSPVVYSSPDLPRMDKLAAARTRALTNFETAALEKLKASEEIVATATTNRIEMLGALRASKQCLECHQVARGQLLGAFSYTLVRDPLAKGLESE